MLQKLLIAQIETTKTWYNNVSMRSWNKNEAVGYTYTGYIPLPEFENSARNLFSLLKDCFDLEENNFQEHEELFKQALNIFSPTYEKYISMQEYFSYLFEEAQEIQQLDKNILIIFFRYLVWYNNLLYEIVDPNFLANIDNDVIFEALREVGYFNNELNLYKFIKSAKVNIYKNTTAFINKYYNK